MSKVMTAQEAISKYLHDGDSLVLGGLTHNRSPYALVREVIRQKKRDLYIRGGGNGAYLDMLIGAGCVQVLENSYFGNSGFTQVCRRYREAVEKGTLVFEDYTLDVSTIIYHGAALGMPYMPIKNMLGSDIEAEWGISEEERKKYPKLPDKKFIVQEDPFHPGSRVCLVPTPEIDVALIHVQKASPDGLCRIEGPCFQDEDIAIAAKHTIISCEELVPDEELRQHPELNTLSGLVVDAVVHAPFGAHPAQCFNYYDYDAREHWIYDDASRTQEAFDAFIDENIFSLKDHDEYLEKIGASRLTKLIVDRKYNYVPGAAMDKETALGDNFIAPAVKKGNGASATVKQNADGGKEAE